MTRALERELRRLVRDVVTAWLRTTRTVHAAAFADVARIPAVDDPDDWVPPRYSVPVTGDLFDEMAANENLNAISERYRVDAAHDTGQAMAGELGVQFDVTNRLLGGVIANQSGMKIVTAPSNVVGGMMTSLQNSYDSGHSIPHAAREMRQAGYAGSKHQAERIARTELTRATNGASLAMVKGGTNLKYKTWIGGTRPAHQEADGQVVRMEEPFVVGGEQLDYPGDDAGSAGNVINCRCTIGYTDEPPETTSIDGPEERDPWTAETLPAMGGGSDAPATWGIKSDQPGNKALLDQRGSQAALRRANAETEQRFADGIDKYYGSFGSYKSMNRVLRGQPLDSPVEHIVADTARAQKKVDAMKSLYDHDGEHGVLSRDTMVFRGMSNYVGEARAGSVMTDAGFMSTSIDEYHAAKFVSAGQEDGIVLRLHVPKDTKFTTPNTTLEEKEMIFAPGTRYVLIGENPDLAVRTLDGGTARTFDAIVLKPGQEAADLLRELTP